MDIAGLRFGEDWPILVVQSLWTSERLNDIFLLSSFLAARSPTPQAETSEQGQLEDLVPGFQVSRPWIVTAIPDRLDELFKWRRPIVVGRRAYSPSDRQEQGFCNPVLTEIVS